MTILALKKDIHKAIDKIEDDKFLKAVYDILWDKASEFDFTLNSTQKAILKEREKNRAQGKSKSYTWAEAKKILRNKK